MLYIKVEHKQVVFNVVNRQEEVINSYDFIHNCLFKKKSLLTKMVNKIVDGYHDVLDKNNMEVVEIRTGGNVKLIGKKILSSQNNIKSIYSITIHEV